MEVTEIKQVMMVTLWLMSIVFFVMEQTCYTERNKWIELLEYGGRWNN